MKIVRPATKGKLTKEYDKALRSSDGERVAADFLKKNPLILFWSFFSMGGHCHYVVPEFGLGKSLRCDFVLIQSHSGGYEVKFIELEPVSDQLFNKNRTPSRRLRIAQKQIHDWQNYIHDEPASIRYQLAEAVTKFDLLYDGRGRREPMNFAGCDLRDPKSFIHFHYHIVIGRRSELSKTNRYLKSSHNYFGDIELVSYDRLLDVAGCMDARTIHPKESIYLPSNAI